MKRKIIDELINWKTEDNGKPLLLTGVKGVGKTYTSYDFAKAFFEQISYLNFEREPHTAELFHATDSQVIMDRLIEYFHINTEDPIETRILILDEISCCHNLLEVLTTIDLSEIYRYIICITSNPVLLKQTGNMKTLLVYPLEFDEFLLATGNEWYIESIITHFNNDTKIPEIVHKELLTLHQLYLQIGGMPGIINEYLNLSSVVNVSEQHSFLIGSYHDNIIRDNSDSDAFKMNQVFDSIILQLMKENKKFQYKMIRKGTTHSMYKEAIQKLCDNNYVIKCSRIESFQSDEWLSDEANTNFKLYLPDTGFLYSKMVEEQGVHVYQTGKKALLENSIAQTLKSKKYPFAFWESESMAKIDFIYLKSKELIPVEIFENDNTRSKSISVLKQKCNFSYAVKISSKNFEFRDQIKYVPYYAAFCL